MALILRSMADAYKYVFTEIADPRTESWFLVASPLPGMAVLGLYLFFVLNWGPKWMKDRKPFNLDRVLLYFNVLQIIACTYLFVEAIRLAWGWKYKWICEPVDWSNTAEAIEIASVVHLYFLVKLADLLDTVFFVLRKKNNQITFLHVYHHTGMVMITWGATKYLPGGHGTLVGVINSFVHIVMYGYYLLTIANPVYKQSIWWKKYITQLQIVQFLWLVLHFLSVLVTPGCAYPRWTVGVFLPQNLFMLILFLDFYRRAYLKKPDQKPVAISATHQDETSQQNGTSHKNVALHQNGVSTSVVEPKNGINLEKRLDLDNNSNLMKFIKSDNIVNGKYNKCY